MWPRDWYYDILAKTLTAFCPCPKCLSETKVKHFGIIALTKEVLKQLSIESVMWLLFLTLMKRVLMKSSKPSKEKYKIYSSRRKGTRCSGAKFCVQRDKQIKKMNKRNNLSREPPTAKFSFWGKELKNRLGPSMEVHTMNPGTQKHGHTDLWAQGQPGVQSKFQESQAWAVKKTIEHRKPVKTVEREGMVSPSKQQNVAPSATWYWL